MVAWWWLLVVGFACWWVGWLCRFAEEREYFHDEGETSSLNPTKQGEEDNQDE